MLCGQSQFTQSEAATTLHRRVQLDGKWQNLQHHGAVDVTAMCGYTSIHVFRAESLAARSRTTHIRPGAPMKISFFIRTIAAALLAASMSAQADPFFTNKEGNLIWDQATGLVWMRCSLGQDWDNNRNICSGMAKKYRQVQFQDVVQSFNSNAGYAGAAAWQVPSIRVFASLRQCSTVLDS